MKKPRNYLSEEALLEGLAEECAELGQAALKMARVIRGENPTPVRYREARMRTLGEIADVRNYTNELLDISDWDTIRDIEAEKFDRWVERLEEHYYGKQSTETAEAEKTKSE